MADVSAADRLAGVLATVRDPVTTRPERRHVRPPGIVLHHSCGGSAQTVAAIRHEHQVERGWADVGYHVVVREHAPGAWRAEPGRPEEYVGAHAPGRNDWLGVCCLGNYEVDHPTRAMLEALTACLVDLCVRYDLPATQIRPHRESGCQRPDGTRGETDCPGQYLIAALPAIVADVAALLEAA